jgi:precorrin-8X/cobalt-precorrin-8 methylmutase
LNPLAEEQMDRPGLVHAGREIEEKSFRIIDAEIGDHPFSPEEWQVVRRVIHTTGDFDYAKLMRFHPLAITAGVAALQRGAVVFTDTRMIQIGLSPWRLRWFGNRVLTPPSEPESQEWAQDMGTTRSVAAFRHCARELEGEVVAIGNSPTALLEVLRGIREEGVMPALVIGAPVGFVQAAESKDALRGFEEQPAITVLGRKGGSSVVVAMVHALLEIARTRKG